MRVPRKLLASGLHLSGVQIDPSHTLALLNSIIFWLECCNDAIKIVRGLSVGCRMKVSNLTKERNLKRLLQGRLPAGMTWPCPGVATPEFIRPYIA